MYFSKLNMNKSRHESSRDHDSNFRIANYVAIRHLAPWWFKFFVDIRFIDVKAGLLEYNYEALNWIALNFLLCM